jgi:hypothetical protein
VHHLNELSKVFEVPVTDFLKDDFEIHKPITIPHNVSKTDLLEMLKTLQKKVEAKRTVKHESYMVVMSLIIAADSSLNVVH